MDALLNLLICESSKSDDFLLKFSQRRIRIRKKRTILIQSQLLQKITSQVPENKNFFSLIEEYPSNIFHNHFGMRPSTFKKLRNALQPFWAPLRGHRGFSLDKCLYVTLWKLCNSRATFGQLSKRFNVGKGTAHDIFFKTIKAICCLKAQIEWPSADQQESIMEQFAISRRNSFPYVVGCVDTTHFKIPALSKDACNYYNQKGYYSIIMQAICDSNFRFLDVFIGYPGSYNNAKVWTNSPIYKAITAGQVKLVPNAIILGDSAYPLSNCVMIPYRKNGQLSSDKKNFNYNLSSIRVFIEQAFAILKQKFKILNYIDVESSKEISKVVLACAILHNFIINQGEVVEYVNISTNPDESDIDPHNASMSMEEADEDIDGISVRSNLTKLYCLNKSSD